MSDLRIRHVDPTDYGPVITALNDWWGGRNMSDMLPRLFFVHFRDLSFVAMRGERIAGFLIDVARTKYNKRDEFYLARYEITAVDWRELEPLRLATFAEVRARSQAGDIGAVVKLKETGTGDTLCDEKAAVRLPEIAFPAPVISFAVVFPELPVMATTGMAKRARQVNQANWCSHLSLNRPCPS